MSPGTLILLANLGRPRRPAGATAAFREQVLPDPATADSQLGELVSRPVSESDLSSLRRVHQVAVAATESLLSGEALDGAELTALALGSTVHLELTTTAGGLRQNMVWSDNSISAGLARRLIEELAVLEPDRLRRCARAECDLVFYDTTRSRTRRWHADDPCGWRQRQHHRRTRN